MERDLHVIDPLRGRDEAWRWLRTLKYSRIQEFNGRAKKSPGTVKRASSLFGLRRRSCFWGDIPNVHPDLPSVALTDINRRPFALELYRIAGLGLKSRTPIPTAPQSIATCTYNMRGILIGPDDTVAGMIFCKYVCKVLLDGLAAVNRIRLWRQENRVFRVQRGYGSGVILIKRILIRFICGIKQLLAQLRIGCFHCFRSGSRLVLAG